MCYHDDRFEILSSRISRICMRLKMMALSGRIASRDMYVANELVSLLSSQMTKREMEMLILEKNFLLILAKYIFRSKSDREMLKRAYLDMLKKYSVPVFLE